ncbi:unnamed protein product, partial [Mesorhabditis belari]|uniref:Uncharacterized protein n=1 Tax=Mesorhabditis belari TaxID=2138241 RepID=A0AAF3FN36_9BILA
MGYVSKLTHVFFDWTTDHDRLPKEAVVKITIPVQMGPVRFENGPFELDDRKIMDDELLFYSRVGNLKFLPPKLKVPQFFCGRRYGVDGVNAGYISMEHIDGSIHRHLYHNVCKNGIFEAIDQLVELAVFSLKYPESLTDWPKFGRTLLDHFLAICDLDKKALQMIEKFPDLKEEIEKYVANYDKVYRDYKRFMEIRRKTCK